MTAFPPDPDPVLEASTTAFPPDPGPVPIDVAFDADALDRLGDPGFVVVDGWLGRGQGMALRQALLELDAAGCFAPARIGAAGGRHEDRAIRGDTVCWFDADAPVDAGNGRLGVRPGREAAQFLERMELLREHLNATCFLSLRVVECHAARYEPGSFYEAHLDTPAGDARRVISFAYYLSERGGDERGGCLRVHGDDGVPTDIEPCFDRLVVFQSRRVRHEVRPVETLRLSMTGWMSSGTPGGIQRGDEAGGDEARGDESGDGRPRGSAAD